MKKVLQSVYFPEKIQVKITAIAQKEKRSFSQVVRTILSSYLEEHDSLDGLTIV